MPHRDAGMSAPALPGAGPEAPPVPPSPAPARLNWLLIVSFGLCVVLPSAVIATHLFATAADQYTARARFTVQALSTRPLSFSKADTADGGLGRSLAETRLSHHTHVAASYLDSGAILTALGRGMDVAAMFRVPEADWFSRLPDGASAEAREDDWRERLRVSVDGPSGIVGLEIRAYRPEHALALAEAMLARTEALLNGLSLRQKQDALARARAEAAESERRLRESIAALAEAQETGRRLDPEREADATLGLLTGLTAERIRLESRLAVLEAAGTGRGARAGTVRTRLAAVREDLASLRGGMAAEASADAGLAAALGRFEELEIRRRFAARLYGLAQTRLIEAEIDMARQSLFLNLFDPPRLPEEPSHPERAETAILASVGLLAGWAILALIWAAVADHRLDRRR